MTHSPPPLRRVLYIVPRFPSLTQTFIANEMEGIAQQSVEIHVASVWSPIPEEIAHSSQESFLKNTLYFHWRQLALWQGVILALLHKPNVLRLILQLGIGHLISPYTFLKWLAAIPKGLYLGHWVKRQNPPIDHLHAHFLTSPATIALIASVVSSIPYTVTTHAIDLFSIDPRTRSASIRLKCQRAAAVVCISHYHRNYLIERWPSLKNARLEVIYNGIDLSLFSADETSSTHIEKKSDRPIIILSNGSLIEKKGHAFLIRAIGELRRWGHSVELRLVGRGPLENELRQLVAEEGLEEVVQFLGTMPQTELVAEYQQADIFALACIITPQKDSDGLPTVLIEALAMGLPTVSTQVAGIPELIRHGETGLCVPAGDVMEIAEALSWLIEHTAEARILGQQGCELVLKNFDHTQNAQHLLRLWNSLGPD